MSKIRTTFDLRITCEADDGSTSLEEAQQEAIELCRYLAEDWRKGCCDEDSEAVCVEPPADECDPFRVEVCDANDGGSCAYAIFSVTKNLNPSGKVAFAVLQEEPESNDRWVHLSKSVCF
jgi:hypothetical protein